MSEFGVYDFRKWLSGAQKGSRLEYFRGSLARERSLLYNDFNKIRRVKRLAEEALTESDIGSVVLCQKRNGANDYSYLAVKT